MKKCTKCKQEKELSEFHRDKQKKDGLSPRCMVCRNQDVDRYRQTHLEEIRKRDNIRRYDKYIKSKEKSDKQSKAWAKANPEKVAKIRKGVSFRKRFRVYGWTPETFFEQIETQEYKCAICEKSIREKWHCHIDHDHATGKVRMLLCPKCNFGIGQFEDNPQLLELAAAYLRGFSVEY